MRSHPVQKKQASNFRSFQTISLRIVVKLENIVWNHHLDSMGFCYSSHTQTTHPCQKPLIKNMWTTITYSWYWCSNGVDPLNLIWSPWKLKSLMSTAPNLQATWQYPDLWLHSHLACRRAQSCGESPNHQGLGHVEMISVGWFSWRIPVLFHCFKFFKLQLSQKAMFNLKVSGLQFPVFLNVTKKRTEKTHAVETLKGSAEFIPSSFSEVRTPFGF